jgi:hypothetical protein
MSEIINDKQHKFAETQRRPTSIIPYTISTKNSSLLTEANVLNEIKILKQTQHDMIEEMKKLMVICNKIGESVTDVRDKLSQYDIDGDEVSNAEESYVDEINESADEDDVSTNNLNDSVNADITVDTNTDSKNK